MNHKPMNTSGLGVTTSFMYTGSETLRRQIEQALNRGPESLTYAKERGQ